MKKFFLFILVCVLIPFLSSCIRNPATRKVHARLLSAEAERKIGEETKKKILEEYQIIKSTRVSAYVERVGQKLALASDRPTVDYNFTVLDSDLINAFAAPGGFIFVTRGLLDSIDDEAELAMVLGHEIAHVAALHGVQMIQKEMGQNALSILGTIGTAIVAGPEAMIMMANTTSLFSSLYLLGYSREKELEADNLGLQYLMRAKYDPHASLRFLKQLQTDDEKGLKGWDLYFRTHPATKDRMKIIESMIGTDTEDVANANRTEYQKIKGDLPRVNLAERGIIKGHLYENEVHKLSVNVPSNWSLGFIYSQALVSFQTYDKKAEGRLQSVELSSMTFTPESLAIQYAKYMGYQFISGRNVLYAAGYGYLGRYMGVSPTGKQLDIRLFATIRHGIGYVLQAGAPPESQESYLLDLESITRGLRFKEG